MTLRQSKLRARGPRSHHGRHRCDAQADLTLLNTAVNTGIRSRHGKHQSKTRHGSHNFCTKQRSTSTDRERPSLAPSSLPVCRETQTARSSARFVRARTDSYGDGYRFEFVANSRSPKRESNEGRTRVFTTTSNRIVSLRKFADYSFVRPVPAGRCRDVRAAAPPRGNWD